MPRAMVEEIVGHLRRAYPLEGCGLLATDLEEQTQARRFFPGTNVDHSAVRFTMDPVEVLRAFREIRQHGWRLGAIVHSHPRTPATPSATDLAEAHYPEALILIVSFQSATPDLRAWHVAKLPGGTSHVDERPIVIG
jgi:[CysO sulfur-carrier protein]-S-L-cysteine hydrolase